MVGPVGSYGTTKSSEVNYRIRMADGSSRPKVVHINTLKVCVEREEPVRRLTVVADEGGGMPKANVMRLKTRHAEFVEEDVRRLQEEFRDVLVDTPGNTEIRCVINVCDVSSLLILSIPLCLHPLETVTRPQAELAPLFMYHLWCVFIGCFILAL